MTKIKINNNVTKVKNKKIQSTTHVICLDYFYSFKHITYILTNIYMYLFIIRV